MDIAHHPAAIRRGDKMIDDATLRRMEAENIACGDTENEWIIRNARRYLALRENEIIIMQAADLDFNPEGYRARYDAAADRLLVGGWGMNSNDIGIADSRNRLREKAQNEATCFALNDMLKDAQEEVRRLREETERMHVQLAGCGVAAMQNTADSREHRITRDDYGWSASYADVCSAVDREISLREENERLRKDAERGQFLVERGEWFRHNSDTPHAYALLAIRLPYAADLSCKAMREYAIDAARGAK